jgi:BirA family biotin operon repressor/biotin-[acetyl-CoA-carboxylase] ligase
MQNQSTPKVQRNARVLRREMTDSERKLWSGPRGGQLGVQFRRQHPLGNYIADFACPAPKLIVELDGSQHLNHVEHDARRVASIRGMGFDLIRFDSNEPFIHLEGVLQAILNRLESLTLRVPIPTFPQWGRSKYQTLEPSP